MDKEETTEAPKPLGRKLSENLADLEFPQSTGEIKEWFKKQTHRPCEQERLSVPIKKITSRFALRAESPQTHLGTTAQPLKLKLRETETVCLLFIMSGYSDPDEEDSAEKNAGKQEITSSDTISLKFFNAETQTAKSSEKSKGCETYDIKATHSFVNASAWDLYDTYAQVGDEGFGIKEFQLLIDTALKTRGVTQAQLGSGSELTKLPADKQLRELVKSAKFQYCVLILERLLASKTFQKKQIILKKKTKGKYDAVSPSLFSYEINIMWTYDNRFIIPLAVTAFDWNPQNNLLLAVGYGRLNFEDAEEGCVCLWSPKNPSHPERKFWLQNSVTTISFSTSRPNILAAGSRFGDIYLIDVARIDGIIQLLPRGGLDPHHGPLWKIEWFCRSKELEEEELMALGEAGVLTTYSIIEKNSSVDILKLEYTISVGSSGLQGIDNVADASMYSVKTLAGLCFSVVPDQHICYVGSQEGVIAKCTIRSPCSIDVRLSGHMGPVYVIQPSPASHKIFLTCGADNYLKIWVDGISEPLITMMSPMIASTKTMLCAQWSPVLPTVIATLTGMELAIWDIARSSSAPVNTLRLRTTNAPFTTLKFSPDGTGLVVGDQQGHVKVYQLSHLPRPPFLLVEALTTAIKASLIRQPMLLHQFTKLLHFSKDEFKTTVVSW